MDMRRSTFWTVCIALASFLMFAEVVLGASSSPWILVSNMITARDQFAGCVIGDKIYVFGGNDNPDGINLNSGEVYDIGSLSWSSIAPNNHTAGIEEVTGVAVDGKFYVFGESFNEVYDPAIDTWTTLASNPAGTSVTVPAVYDGKIYLFGGHGPDGPGGATVHSNVVEVYDPVSDTWQSEANMPKTLGGPAVAVYNDSAYVIGGFDMNANKMNMEVMVYNFASNTWTRNYCTAPGAAYFYCANSTGTQTPVIDGKAYLVGGIEGTVASNGPTSKFTIFDITSCQWQTGPSLPEPRAGNLTVADNNEIYVIGGYAGRGNSNSSRPSKSTVYCLSSSKKMSAVFNDSNGIPVTLSVTGGGWYEIAGDNNDFNQITLHDTTAKSIFTIKTAAGQHTSIGNIIVNGPLKAITAKTTNLRGDITVNGSLGTLALGDVKDGHTITIGSSSNPNAAVTIVLDQVADLSINSDMPIKSISATEWLGGLINAPSVGSITTKGNKKQSIAGDIDVNVTLDGSINSAKVAGTLSGDWTCNSIKSISAMDVVEANLVLSQEPNIKIMALGNLTAKGRIDSSQIISQGNIGTVTAGAMINSVCFAGIADACLVDVTAADGVFDLPPVLDDTFNQTATIKSIAIKGIKGEDPNFFINSNIAAKNVSSIYIAYPQYNNAGVPFGISMYNNPAKTFTIKDANGTHSWKGSNIGTAIDWLTNLGYDMQIRRD